MKERQNINTSSKMFIYRNVGFLVYNQALIGDIFSRDHLKMRMDAEKIKYTPSVNRKAEHPTSELGLLSQRSLARSSPAVLLTACSNTSTFSISVRWS